MLYLFDAACCLVICHHILKDSLFSWSRNSIFRFFCSRKPLWSWSAGGLSYVGWNPLSGTLHDIPAPVAGNYPQFCVNDLLKLDYGQYQRKLVKCAGKLGIQHDLHEILRKKDELDHCIAVKLGLVIKWNGHIVRPKLEQLRANSTKYGGKNSMKFRKVAKKCRFWYDCIDLYCNKNWGVPVNGEENVYYNVRALHHWGDAVRAPGRGGVTRNESACLSQSTFGSSAPRSFRGKCVGLLGVWDLRYTMYCEVAPDWSRESNSARLRLKWVESESSHHAKSTVGAESKSTCQGE